MNEHELDQMLRRAASALPAPASVQDAVMQRVRTDSGRAARWRSFVRWLLLLAVGAAIITACVIGYLRASRDTTHTTPPPMKLFQEGLPR
jgi:anti-sigma factor RsiW